MFHNTANGATASALVHSISETAKLNNLRRTTTLNTYSQNYRNSVMNKEI